MLYTNLSQIKTLVKNNQGDIALVIGFVLVAIIAFGVGRLTAPPIVRNPIIVENAANNGDSANISGSITSAASQNNQLVANTQTNTKGMFVGSKNSNLYHWPWCAPAKNIKLENEVWFDSEAAARAAGRTPSSCVAKEAPAGYVSQ